MAYYLSKPINIPLDADASDAALTVARAHKLKATDVVSCRLYRRSVDARNKNNVHFVCSYVFATAKSPFDAKPYAEPTDVILNATKTPSNNKHVIVVGAGPAGLFCALYLSKCGVKVTVIERGQDIQKRQQSVTSFFNGEDLNPNSNVQFGLGGAGTFSDGKLTTGISSPLIYTVFNQFVLHGAPPSIMTDAMPHIGTDKLVSVVDNLKNSILSFGGEFLFDTTVTDFVVKDGAVVGVRVQNLQKTYNITADKVVLACGHSARDTFAAVKNCGANVSFKPFSVGVRIEHSRRFINQAQYGQVYATHRDLPSASYKLVYNGKDHSCYSFCMCPGGSVVAATSEVDSVVVNGMSNFARDERNSNSALVVNVTADDVREYGFGSDPFAGVRFQQHLEKASYQLGGGDYVAPCQSVADFLTEGSKTPVDNSEYDTVIPTYPRKTAPCNLWQLLPRPICNTLAEGLKYFDHLIKGFGRHGVLTAVESRTSSPIKILRDQNLESNIKNLYPTGEGAGYAGGIVSSAVDGLKVAQAIVLTYKR